MKTAILFIIVLANSFLLRTVIAVSDSFTKNYIEEETALLTCSSEFNEIMKIATIKYEIGNCSYNELYGIGNLCNGRTKCTFKVNNSNIGSSCGANGTASLGVTYNCIRNGGWTQWKNATTSCPVNCGGALQNVTRTCTNPTPNEFGAPCSGTSFDEQICNDNACPFAGTVCKDSRIVWTCRNGYIQMKRAWWKASNGCGEPGSISSYDVVREMVEICNKRKSCTFTANDSTFKLSCRQQFKTCSQLEFEYICKNANWSSWTKWSVCSKSCGTGKQIRTRNCLNQFNTMDGYFVDCEGSSVKTRVCNTIQCPYCKNSTFPHYIPRNRKLKRDVSSNSVMADFYKIGCCGTVNAFEFIPMNTGEVTFIVWRRVRGHAHKAIKKITISVTDQNIGMYVRHNLTKYERIAVVRNDNVGWYDGGNNIIGYYDCSPNNETYTAVELSFADYSIEIPDNSAVDTYVTHIRIEDQDEGDFIENIKQDYNNQYFYFDTKLRNVYPQFYTDGQDSCYNEATSSVTIITYNVPPLISGIQNCLIIDPDVAQMAPYLTVFNSNLKTEMFYLQLINLDVYLKLVNGVSIGRDSTSQYILTIICDDGTENPELDLRIQFRPQNEDAIVQMYTEGGRAYLTCSGECNETIDITSIKYTKGPCSHSETYGIRNICNGKTNCSFGVSNSNIGSSCGANGTAMFKVEYYCIRNGGWSGWTTPASCPVNVELGFITFQEPATCNTHDCVVQNTACLNEKVDWNCPNGHIEVIKAEWETNKPVPLLPMIIIWEYHVPLLLQDVQHSNLFTFVSRQLGKAGLHGQYVQDHAEVVSRQDTDNVLTKMNTKDGYKVDCNGNGSHSRSCHTEPCPSYVDAGMGPVQTVNFITALNLPTVSITTLKSREREIGKTLEEYAKWSCQKALEKEIALSKIPETTANIAGNEETEVDGQDAIHVSFDGAWQKRGSGRCYNSLTGHATLLGETTGKCVNFGLKYGDCRKCDRVDEKGDGHDCRINHQGSAKSMESELAVQMVKEIQKTGCVVSSITMDDDSTTIARLRKEVNAEIMKFSDRNHVRKKVSRDLIGLQEKHKISMNVVNYLTKDFSYALSQNKGNPENLRKVLKSIIPHAFGDHILCDKTWCQYHKNPDTYKHKSLPYGKNLTGEELRNELNKLFDIYASNSEKLSHLGSSQGNESLNNMIALKAPKAKHFGGSESLAFRVASGVAQKNEGRSYITEASNSKDK
ncbi:unnamed protein product [Mytilus edulis]|uniref:Mutator-like transposase domain-containing protein n=1 Tax=Mytilus edulis TaxID=6550 RepID=A0A8S3UGH5_MYTED|nr:unnamed protein product [Mytilus edulis]